ncbi:tRNA pseudouridine(13) synthase TruD [Vreelandella venusta]|uniref:tRNA pseudouridine synthase D n=1 Tax=Vreelandella venusta TaxID=44935 RepID=A0ABX2BCT0_9GAMM|nr:tRNA pseudouridine(13) synthase TruD [Halomonas venusta]AZM97015.1 tRNA pseudouridine(13) synthase TruD [Halomonas venusta]MDW0359587.1 tRNA pseudouridine(13) synthase TruD [Halomonas venusta]NPT31932.1 tRNA pseudouridine(13) synthase TruD [Halomonas venusta]QPI63298.1 tRNA pseudouridine(13) synthase TruD [Halomonas venusta]UQI39772.1 tRNA pseudouridine(13) synthase TruD [Halomonas venusta]
MLNLPAWQRSLDAEFGAPSPGCYRVQPEDFIVDEQLDFTPENHGEHLWLRLEKRHQTTLDVVKSVSRLCGVTLRDVGYSGMKDRVAVTRQWLSVHLPGREAPSDLSESLAAVGIKVLAQARHPRKLKRGVHRTNHFTLRLSGEALQRQHFVDRWEALCHHGVPNYFGPQRFGPEGRNLQRAEALLAKGWRKRDDRQGMMLSTARSFLFNELLSERLADGTWCQPLAGDMLMLDGTHSVFTVDTVDDDLVSRAAALDIHPTGALWGVGELAEYQVADYEKRLLARHPVLCEGLLKSAVKRSHRALRARLISPSIEILPNAVVLSFALPRGSFATAVVSELIAHPDFA